MVAFTPKLTALPAPQRVLWSALGTTLKIFTLYSGTALVLRLTAVAAWLDVTRLPTLTPFARRPAP